MVCRFQMHMELVSSGHSIQGRWIVEDHGREEEVGVVPPDAQLAHGIVVFAPSAAVSRAEEAA